MNTTYRQSPTTFQEGQTLLEAIVAIAVILVGVVAGLTLAISTIKGGKSSEMQVTASNLAREGVEVVRQQRDNNWLKIESNVDNNTQKPDTQLVPWDDGLSGSGQDYTAIAEFDSSIEPATWALDYKVGKKQNCQTDCMQGCINDQSCVVYFYNGGYTQKNLGGSSSTPFYRLIQTNEICQDDSIQKSGKSCPNNNPKIGIQVISEVRWSEKGSMQKILYEDHLYNWK